MDYGDARLPDRFWAKVYPEPNTGCWLWGNATDGCGYGMMARPHYVTGARMDRAHRLTLSLVEPVGGKVAMHSCDTPACVNPEHLTWGSRKDNNADRDQKGRHASRRVTHCPQGHEYSDVNTRIKGGKYRVCKSCAREYASRKRQSS